MYKLFVLAVIIILLVCAYESRAQEREYKSEYPCIAFEDGIFQGLCPIFVEDMEAGAVSICMVDPEDESRGVCSTSFVQDNHIMEGVGVFINCKNIGKENTDCWINSSEPEIEIDEDEYI